MPILKNIGTLYQCRPAGSQADVHPIKDAAIVWQTDKITWLGKESELPQQFNKEEQLSAKGAMLIPGLVDSHTHLAFAGNRSNEFEMRSQGKSYLEIAAAGGGIASTVNATRQASAAQLEKHCLDYLKKMLALGVTAIECKSGYGLSLESELRTLEVYRLVADKAPQTIVPTLLAAHTIPSEFKDSRSEYINLIIEKIIPQVGAQKLAEFCDVFVEQSAFTYAEGEKVLKAGIKHGLVPRIHADQLSNSKGAELAGLVKAVSADHLEFISKEGIGALKANGVIAGLLPFSSLYLNQKPVNARDLVNAEVEVSVATNFNPGSAPNFHLPLAMTLACTMNSLTPAESLKAATIIGAKVIKRDSIMGSLEPGKLANFALIEAESVNDWLYEFKPNACKQVFIAGKPQA